MKEYRVVVKTEGHEIYYVEAESEKEALNKWDSADPTIAEVTDSWVHEVTMIEDYEGED